MNGLGFVASMSLLVSALGSDSYRVRVDAEAKLKAMPWAEPVLLARMNDSLEIKMRSKAILDHWRQSHAPLEGETYTLETEQEIVGWAGKFHGDYVTFFWRDDLVNVTRHLEVNWKLNVLRRHLPTRSGEQLR